MFLKNSVFSCMLAAMGIAASISISCKAAGTESIATKVCSMLNIQQPNVSVGKVLR